MTRAPLLAVWVAAVATAGEACELPGGGAQRIESPRHVVLYRAQPTPRVGEHFALEFAVCPAPDAVRVDATMPEHRHGMNYRPTVTAQGGGRYRAEGLMFHMAGRWELVFEVRAGGKTERVAQSLKLE
jgi:hypothetical protein